MLWRINDPDIAARAQIAPDEANEAAGNSCIHINSLQTRLEFLNTDSKADSIMGGQQPGGGKTREGPPAGREERDQGGIARKGPQHRPEAGERSAGRGQWLAFEEGPRRQPGISDFFSRTEREEESISGRGGLEEEAILTAPACFGVGGR
jgi:hypothetical protein